MDPIITRRFGLGNYLAEAIPQIVACIRQACAWVWVRYRSWVDAVPEAGASGWTLGDHGLGDPDAEEEPADQEDRGSSILYRLDDWAVRNAPYVAAVMAWMLVLLSAFVTAAQVEMWLARR